MKLSFCLIASAALVTLSMASPIDKCPRKRLNDGHLMPMLGIGTCILGYLKPTELPKVYDAVKTAIRAGYRMIDTAWIYGTEDQVGRAIADSIREGIVTREQMFVTTKLWLPFFGKGQAKVGLQQSLERMGLEYVNLFLIHWPVPIHPVAGDPYSFANGYDNDMDIYTETWSQMEELKRSGLAKSIGVSNFNHLQLEALLKVATIKPAMNQIECHPLLSQVKLIEFCHKHDIQVTAYSPLGSSKPGPNDADMVDVNTPLFANQVLKNLAAKYQKSQVQVMLRYHLQRDVISVPKSVQANHVLENIEIFDFELSKSDLELLEGINTNLRNNPSPKFKKSKYYPFDAEF